MKIINYLFLYVFMKTITKIASVALFEIYFTAGASLLGECYKKLFVSVSF